MKVIDLHCDVVLRLYESSGKLKFKDSPELDTNYERLITGGGHVQEVAIVVWPVMT